MSKNKNSPGASEGATGAMKPNQSSKIDCPKLANFRQYVTYRIEPDDPDLSSFCLSVRGRQLWTLVKLLEAGPAGCTPLCDPAPRWSSYVHELRNQRVPIETILEAHEGLFPGLHARYVIRATAYKHA